MLAKASLQIRNQGWEDRSQGSYTTGLMGSKVPSLGAGDGGGAGRPHLPGAEGLKLITRNPRSKVALIFSKEPLGSRRAFIEGGVEARRERRETSNLHEGKTGF